MYRCNLYIYRQYLLYVCIYYTYMQYLYILCIYIYIHIICDGQKALEPSQGLCGQFSLERGQFLRLRLQVAAARPRAAHDGGAGSGSPLDPRPGADALRDPGWDVELRGKSQWNGLMGCVYIELYREIIYNIRFSLCHK